MKLVAVEACMQIWEYPYDHRHTYRVSKNPLQYNALHAQQAAIISRVVNKLSRLKKEWLLSLLCALSRRALVYFDMSDWLLFNWLFSKILKPHNDSLQTAIIKDGSVMTPWLQENRQTDLFQHNVMIVRSDAKHVRNRHFSAILQKYGSIGMSFTVVGCPLEHFH